MNESWKSEPHNLLRQECIAYLREYSVFDRILRGFREKYASYGQITGTVVLHKLTQEEREVLEGFFQRSFHGQKSISISAKRFEAALLKSRFKKVSPKDILEGYFKEALISKKERKEERESVWQQVFDEVIKANENKPGATWLLDMWNMKTGSYLYLQKKFRESQDEITEVKQALQLGARIVNELPTRQGKTEYLAVFAANLTGNPHAFDEGIEGGQFLTQVVEWVLKKQTKMLPEYRLFRAFQKQRMYLEVGILKDDISNYAILSGIRVQKKTGELHQGMEGFYNEAETVQVPLSNIVEWKRIICPKDTIYIVENPSIHAILTKHFNRDFACMCMNGQPKLSALLVLELLASSDITVYYAGDFDPEGLLIAQKLKQYYKGEFRYWHMEVEDYGHSKPNVPISMRRIKMLEKIEDKELEGTVRAIQEKGMAGYQENIWEVYLESCIH